MNLPYDPGQGRRSGPNWSRINQWLLWIGLAAAVAWMFLRHNAHLLQLLPFLFILACPLMHIFGHGGHGGHGSHGDAPPRNEDEPPTRRPEPDPNRQPPAGGHAGHHH
jgi:hypothetical protein